MKNNLTIKYKSIIRKKIASLRFQESESSAREIKKLRNRLSNKLDSAEMIKILHLYDHSGDTKNCKKCIKLANDTSVDISFGKFISTLQQLLTEEEASFKLQLPSQTDIKRWALKWAVLEYYKSLQIPPQTRIIEDLTQNKTIHQLAPDSDVVYNLWTRKLSELARKLDANKFDVKQLDTVEDRGFGRGTAFEKQLQRYREQTIKRMLNK